MTVSERLRSCWGPSRLAHHPDLRSSQWRKPQILHLPPFEWTTTSLLWYPFRCVELKALSSQAIFMFPSFGLFFIHKIHALSSLFSNCHVKKPACFYEPQFGQISLNISLSNSVLKTKRKFGQTCLIRPVELLQIVNFHGFKIESNAWGIWQILYYETNREALSVLCCVENHSEVLLLIWYP